MDSFEISFEFETDEIVLFLNKYGTVFQSPVYLKLVGSVEGYLCYRDESLMAVLPLVLTRKNLVKGYHIPPYTHVCGIVTSTIGVYESNKIYNRILEFLIKRKAHFDFKISGGKDVLLPWFNNGFRVTLAQTYVINSSIKYDTDKIHSSKKRYLLKLLKLLADNRIRIQEGESCFDDLLYLQRNTGERNNFKTHCNTLERIIWELPEDKKYGFVIYDQNNIPTAGAFCPYDRFSAYHLVNASTRVTDKLMNKSNILSTYLAVKRANDMSISFDFEGSSIPGVASFYRMMGGDWLPMYRVQRSSSCLFHASIAIRNLLRER